MNYKHTQIGYLLIFVLLAVILYFGIFLKLAGLDPILVAFLFLILFFLASFVSLKVTVNEKHLRIKFGYGIFTKRFELEKIVSVKAVKNAWYHGWGIRIWFWPYLWIYNISGFDAVEIKMKNGKRYRVGTDEPKKLESALIQAIKR